MEVRFIKMHGTGNDFIVIDARKYPEIDWQKISPALCDRHFGIGADQLLLLCNPTREDADYRMRIFNADGSEVEMCGNGIRCFAKYVNKYVEDKDVFRVDTLAGIVIPEIVGEMVKVDMGEPILEGREIPVDADGKIIDYPLEVAGREWRITAVSMGNPHAVVRVDNVDELDLREIGPQFEHHPFFPNRVNTEFIEVVGDNELKMRVWERGSGETLACGTGASASTVAAILNGWVKGPKVRLHLLGGDLEVEWNRENNHVYLYGPAEEVFHGFFDSEKFLKEEKNV